MKARNGGMGMTDDAVKLYTVHAPRSRVAFMLIMHFTGLSTDTSPDTSFSGTV